MKTISHYRRTYTPTSFFSSFILIAVFTVAIPYLAIAQCASCTGGTRTFAWFNGTTGAKWDIASPAANGTASTTYTFSGPSGNTTVTVRMADLPAGNGSMIVNADECPALSSVGGSYNQYFTGTSGQTSPGACTPNTITGFGYFQLTKSTAINPSVPANSVLTVTFKFSTPAYLNNFKIVDIDYYGAGLTAGTANQNYQDRVRIKALSNGTAVNLSASNSTVGGPSNVTVLGSGTTQVTGVSGFMFGVDGNDTDPSNAADQHTWMFVNSGCALVDSVVLDYDNALGFSNLLQTIGLGGFDFCYKTVSIAGSVYNDADGIANGFSGASKIYNPSGTPLYAYLLDQTGMVATSPVAVATDGSYIFPNVTSAKYSVSLSTTNTGAAGIGVAPPAANLPAGWTATGEIIGTGTINDGSADSKSAAFTVDATAANVVNINFGIEKVPVSPDQYYTLAQPLPLTFLTLNGTGAPNNPGPLKGTDLEDGSLGSGNTFSIVSIAGMNGNKLIYNGVQITGAATITNYNPALLKIQYTAIGTQGAGFTYASQDAAAKTSITAIYSLTWSNPLAAQTVQATVTTISTTAQLKWSAGDETNIIKFYAERSYDGQKFTTVATVTPKGITSNSTGYSIQDDLSTAAGAVVYYRIKYEETDGKISYSNMVVLRVQQVDKITCWPNPFSTKISIAFNANASIPVTLLVTDFTGRTLETVEQLVAAGANQLTISNLNLLPRGIYLLKVQSKSDGKVLFSQKLIKE